MAIKMFCDICNDEVSDAEESSVFQFIKWIMNEQGMRPNKTEEMYCGGCTKNIRTNLATLKEGVNAPVKTKK